MTQHPELTLSALQEAAKGAVAIRAVSTLQPAAGQGAKVFPPTYAQKDRGDTGRYGEARYATERRRIDGAEVDCVLLDSVASQANRMEEALLAQWSSGAVDFPVVRVDFSDADLAEPVGTITTLDAPHRIFDAIFRDSVDAEARLFRQTEPGRAVTSASSRDASALFTYCPTALIFGAWDSTGPKGGLGTKFPRAISSEIVAINAVAGTRVASRIDPLQITKVTGVVYKQGDGQEWTHEAPKKGKAKAVAPSEVNHGNVAPTRDRENGGVTFDHARQTTVVSLAAIRRLRFGGASESEVGPGRQIAAHTALAALAVAAITHARAAGHDLRSGTLLIADGPLTLELLDGDGSARSFKVTPSAANALVKQAAFEARRFGLGWEREPIETLRPAPKLVHLLRVSQAQQLALPVDDA